MDQSADLDMAAEICFNAKVQRPGVCNAMETLLVHEAVAPHFLPDMDKAIQHICRYGSQHTDAIVTSNIEQAQLRT